MPVSSVCSVEARRCDVLIQARVMSCEAMSAKVKGTTEDCHVAAKLGGRGKYVPNSSWMVRMERISS